MEGLFIQYNEHLISEPVLRCDEFTELMFHVINERKTRDLDWSFETWGVEKGSGMLETTEILFRPFSTTDRASTRNVLSTNVAMSYDQSAL